MIPYIKEMGEALDVLWREHGYEEGVFADLAFGLLQSVRPADREAINDILNWTFSSVPGVEQPKMNDFGQPPIKLYQGKGFYIEALFWLTSTTAIHEHSFSGAFTPLLGSSVHSRWHFDRQRRMSSHFYSGRLTRLTTERLRRGDIQKIRGGAEFIHQLFHLEHPSVTLVVRTDTEVDHLPQLSYMPPGIAYAPRHRDEQLNRQVALLHAMMSSELAPLRRYADLLLSSGDLLAVYKVLSSLSAAHLDPELFAELVAVARSAHGEVVDEFVAAIEYESRIRLVQGLRDRIKDPEHRYFLALLMLMPDRKSLLEVLEQEYGDDPRRRILNWVGEMSDTDTIGIELDELNTTIFRCLMEDLDSKYLLTELEREFEAEEVRKQEAEILRHARKLAASELFRPLFTGTGDLGTGRDGSWVS